MKIYLDLLPDSRKEEIKKKKNYKILLGQEIRIITPLIFFIIVLAAVNFNLKIQLDTLEKADYQESSQQGYQELKAYENKFGEINSKVKIVSSLQANHLHWSNVLDEIDVLFPENIYLSNIATENYKLSLSGKAKSRDDLIAFQEKLENSECFGAVDVPLSNLVSKEDVVFKIIIDVSQECLKRLP